MCESHIFYLIIFLILFTTFSIVNPKKLITSSALPLRPNSFIDITLFAYLCQPNSLAISMARRLLTFLGTIAEEYQDKVNFVVYEVADNTDNWDLYEKVGAKFGDEVSGYPYMVIGTKVFNGYASSDDEEIIETIEEYAAEENPYDVVAEVESGNLDEVKTEEESSSGIVLAFIFGVVIVLILIMGYTLNKKSPKKA